MISSDNAFESIEICEDFQFLVYSQAALLHQPPGQEECCDTLRHWYFGTDAYSAPEPPPPKRLSEWLPAPPPVGFVAGNFDSTAYGPEYLSLVIGDAIFPCSPPAGTDPEGWAYGVLGRTGHSGWYPPTYVVWMTDNLCAAKEQVKLFGSRVLSIDLARHSRRY